MWWPSGGLSAVHYVLCADFATRSWPCELLISRPEIGRVATALTMLTEALDGAWDYRDRLPEWWVDKVDALRRAAEPAGEDG
jgi:hypothetical protein